MSSSVSLIGNLTRDIEVKYLDDGTPVGRVSVAVDFGYGEKKKTGFWELTIFGKLVDALKPRLLKGVRISVLGAELHFDKWTDRDGNNRHKHYLVLSRSGTVNVFNTMRQDREETPGGEERKEPVEKDQSVSQEREQDVLPF